MTSNPAASIRARLKNHADATGQDFQRVLDRYGLERLLYRVSASRHAARFVLKGALLFSTWYDTPHRPTRDADFLGYGPDDIASVEHWFRDIAEVADADGLVIDPATVRGSEIRLEQGYGGVRIVMHATLDGMRIKLQADIGFGDAVTPDPEEIAFPVLLDGMSQPHLRAYPRYTVIAEKLHAICVLGIANSRMKDYFDLHVLIQDGDLDDSTLAEAIRSTFERRKTPVPATEPVGLTPAFASDGQKVRQWKAFLSRNRLDASELDATVSAIAARLLPLLSGANDPARSGKHSPEHMPDRTPKPAATSGARQGRTTAPPRGSIRTPRTRP
jgi:hypothetical protein